MFTYLGWVATLKKISATYFQTVQQNIDDRREKANTEKKNQQLVNFGEVIYVFIIPFLAYSCDLKVLKQKIETLNLDRLGISPAWSANWAIS